MQQKGQQACKDSAIFIPNDLFLGTQDSHSNVRTKNHDFSAPVMPKNQDHINTILGVEHHTAK